MLDLRESDAIEQDADTVILLNPEIPEDREPNSSAPYQVTAIIGKQRNGPRGEVPLTFFPEFTRYENAARIADEDVALLL
jgi:replicative DNA helicase